VVTGHDAADLDGLPGQVYRFALLFCLACLFMMLALFEGGGTNKPIKRSASGFKQGAHASKCERKGRK
jgi:hypothetical protein